MRLCLEKWSSWAPGCETPEDWQAWADSKKELSLARDSPALLFVDPMIRRRMSQLSKMIVQVGYEVAQPADFQRLIFASSYGEVQQQYRISKKLIEESEVSPAAFSVSVFNTPVAHLSIVIDCKHPASAIFGGQDIFFAALLEAASVLHDNSCKKVIVLLGDECLPDEYNELTENPVKPYACAFKFSRDYENNHIQFDLDYQNSSEDQVPDRYSPSSLDNSNNPSPLIFVKWLLQKAESSLTIGGSNATLHLERLP